MGERPGFYLLEGDIACGIFKLIFNPHAPPKGG